MVCGSEATIMTATMLRGYLDRTLRDAGRVELRYLGTETRLSGIYSDGDLLHRDALAYAKRPGNLYTTLSAPRRDIPATNRMGEARALTDADIETVTRIPMDWDTVRPPKVNATDEEVRAAEALRDQCAQALLSMGWPMPLLGMSGNGAHAVYRCRLRASDELREALAAIYAMGRSRYSDDRAQYDPVVRNPARIWRIYGTHNTKYQPTPGRPQRLATCRVPSWWGCVDPRALYRVAEACARRISQRSVVLAAGPVAAQ
jgi:hypothetical protein